MIHDRIRRTALLVPAIRRLVAHRNELLSENERLRRALGNARAPAPALPARVGSLCTLVNPAHWLDPEWLALHEDLSRYSVDHHCFRNLGGHIHRKGWEWTHCLYGLRRLGMLGPDRTALGVGVGRECVSFWLTDHIGHVTATDLYERAGVWITEGGKEADLELLEWSKSACPPSVDFSKIVFASQDGTNLTYPDNSFDFAWSLSSIEHFGGHGAARRAVEEMVRVVRPGGIVAVATECLLLDDQIHHEFFNRREIDEYLIEPITGARLVDHLDFDTLPYEYLVDSVRIPGDEGRLRRHVVLNCGDVQLTSCFLFYRVV